MPAFPIAVLISGSGSTLLNLLQRSADGRLQAQVCGVTASRECAGLRFADEYGVPWEIVPRILERGSSDPQSSVGAELAPPAEAPMGEGGASSTPTAGLKTRAPQEFDPVEFSQRVTSVLDRWQPMLVCLAGFLSPYIPTPRYAGRVINIHPAPLPEFGGKGMYGERVHAAVLARGLTETACTVHLVDDQYDHGAVLAERRVPVLPGDTPHSLAKRVIAAERELYPEVINRFAAGEWPAAAE